ANRQQLFRHAEQADLELGPDQLLPETVILLARPSNDELSWSDRSRDAGVRARLLLKFWRRLFHARVHLALMERQAAGQLTPEGVAARAEEVGRTEFEEVRAVLVKDEFLPADADDLAVYIEFAAVYLELRYFATNLLPNYFPGIRDFSRVEAVLGR